MWYQYLSTEKEKKHAVGIEEVVRRQRHLTSDADIVREVQYWVEDPKYTRTRETRYFQLAEMYWIMKAMVAQAMWLRPKGIMTRPPRRLKFSMENLISFFTRSSRSSSEFDRRPNTSTLLEHGTSQFKSRMNDIPREVVTSLEKVIKARSVWNTRGDSTIQKSGSDILSLGFVFFFSLSCFH
jgi:hypothetical protein